MKLIITLLLALAFSSSSFAADSARGKTLFQTCIQCHGDNGQGNIEKDAPRIGGQLDWYIISSLKAFKSGERKNEVMMPFIKNLGNKDFEDLAAYLSTLK